MIMKHLLVEGFCDGDKQQGDSPCNDLLKFGIYCLECPKFSYAPCPNEIAISDDAGIVEECIGFGGTMDPEDIEKRDEYVSLWKKICREKINEAHLEYFDQISKLSE